MPISAPSWTDFLICPICTHEFEISFRAPITLACGHTICKNCLATLHRKQCPFDQTNITKDLDNLPINYALLQLVPSSTSSNNIIEHEILPSIIQTLTAQDLQYYKNATRCIEELALYLRPSSNISALLSRPMQRKLVTLINCQLIEDEGRARSLRAARSLGERTVTELILQHQNPQLLSTHLWAAVRARGCQFLGPAMQEEVLKLVLLALEDGSSLSRKVLVLYVVSQLVTTFPQASKTSIGHVVQLLYRASCFKVSKRESDSSLMTLKEEFRTYEALRREHDAQIVQIATEAGLRIAPDQWSALLYGDNNHKSHMQSIIDKQQNPSSFALSVHELVLALQRTGDPANLSRLRNHMDNLANIDSSSEPSIIPTWIECSNALDSVKQVVNGLIDFIQHHGSRKTQENAYLQNTSRYKVSFCRELQNHGNCARGQNCNFAHSDEELERYRAKYKKNTMRNSSLGNNGNNSINNINNNNGNGNGSNINNNNNKNGSNGGGGGSNSINNQIKESNNFNASNGPNQKVNMNHHSTFAKNNQDNSSSRFSSKSMSYRNEHHHSMTPNNSNHHHHNHHSNHLKPTNVYSNSSSTSTPNLSLPLSPSQHKIHSPNGPRFAFNGNNPNYNNNNYSSNNFLDSPHPNLPTQTGKFMNRPPLSAPPITQQNYIKSADYKKQLSPYHGHNNMPNAFSSPTHNNMNNNNNHFSAMKSPNNTNGGYYGMQNQQQQPPTHFFNNHNSPYNNNNNNTSSNDECNTSSSSSASFGGDQKYVSWNRGQDKQQQSKSPNNLMPKSPTTSQQQQQQQQQQFNKPTNASPINRFDVSPNHDYNNKLRNPNVNHINMVPPSNYVYHSKNSGNNDETDGMTNMWNFQQFNQPPQPSPQMMKSTAPYHFPPNNATMMSGSINKDKFIRSDSILTANTDDSYDNLPTNGKYGAIGGSKNSDINNFIANQWSGLQTVAALSGMDNNNFDIGSTSSGSGNDSFKSIDLAHKSNDAHLNIGPQVNQNSQHNYNESFLNMTTNSNISSASASNDFWPNDSLKWNESKKEEHDKWNLELLKLIDE